MSTRTSEEALERSIRDSALNNVARMRRAPDDEGEVVAANLGNLVESVAGASVSEINRLVENLQELRKHIEGEGERVRREIAGFAHLSKSSAQSTDAITQALDQFKRALSTESKGQITDGT